MTAPRLLVPVSESVSLRNTVAYAVQQVLETEDGADASTTPAVHFVYPLSQRLSTAEEAADDVGEVETARELLDRVRLWAEEDLGDDADRATVETALVGTREYLFDPGDYADVLVEYAREHDLDRAVFDPEYNPVGTTPLLPPLENEIQRAGIAVEEAPVQRQRSGVTLVRRGTAEQFLALFGITYLFYLVLAGSLATFELATGAISAGVVAVALWRVSLTGPVDPVRAGRQLLRLTVYVPFLLWEITKANLQIAYVVLHPDLPIDPEVVEFEAAVWSPLSVTTLANSITLTPGTLTVDVDRRQFAVHTLTSGSRADLLTGTLERAVRFVFYGRAAARIPGPAERRDGDGTEQGEKS